MRFLSEMTKHNSYINITSIIAAFVLDYIRIYLPISLVHILDTY